MLGKYDNVRIKGIVTTPPDHFVDNMELADNFDEKVLKKQIRVTGIKKRAVCLEGQRAADLCITAAKKVLQSLNWKPDDVSCLVFVSSYASYRIPSTASFIKKELEIEGECLFFDINLACSGFVAGLQTVGGLFEGRKKGTKALLLVADTTSESVTGDDKSTSILFGDCGAAIALEKEEGNEIIFLQKSDGEGYKDLIRIDGDHPFEMDGMGVFNFSIKDVVETVKEFLNDSRIDREAIQYFFIHQAQKFIVDKVRDFAEIPKDKVPVTYDEYGNTGCASIPLTMCKIKDRFRRQEKTKVFLCGFGGGHSWGCAILDIYADTYFEICLSNKIYRDGREN